MSSENIAQDNAAGKKIFFLYPTPSIVNQVIQDLAQQEYEVYVARDHSRLSYALKKYSDSIIYINIDDKLSEAEWEKWISSILILVPTLKIGCFTSNADEERKKKITDKMNISGGFLPNRVDMSNISEKIMEYLESVNAKGRRKYLRAAIESDKNTTMNIPHNDGFINSNIKDISVVGLSCVFDSDPDIKKNTLIKAIQIKLQSVLINADGIVFGSREEQEEKIYVILFTPRNASEIRAKIRKYIQQNLQSKMDSEIN